MSNTIDKQALFKAKLELADFLEQYPHMRPFQEEINEELRKAGSSSHNRMVVLQQLMNERIKRLGCAMEDLRKESIKVIKELKDE